MPVSQAARPCDSFVKGLSRSTARPPGVPGSAGEVFVADVAGMAGFPIPMLGASRLPATGTVVPGPFPFAAGMV